MGAETAVVAAVGALAMTAAGLLAITVGWATG
jgi:hypothetical protein